jgi:hypothetical protein
MVNKRSILYRSGRFLPSRTPVIRGAVSTDYSPSYDERKLTDPMQRAGVRLLSATVIPIQKVARRYLASRTALMRMWAIVLIQTLGRRELAYSAFQTKKHGALLLQRVFRGGP